MYNGHLPAFLFMNRSIVRGSGIGPVLFIVFVADLRTESSHNIMSKYADDTTLISFQAADICITTKFSNLDSWSQCNKLTINLTKTKELVLRKPSVKSHFRQIILLMLNALTNSDIWVYLLLPVFYGQIC